MSYRTLFAGYRRARRPLQFRVIIQAPGLVGSYVYQAHPLGEAAGYLPREGGSDHRHRRSGRRPAATLGQGSPGHSLDQTGDRPRSAVIPAGQSLQLNVYRWGGAEVSLKTLSLRSLHGPLQSSGDSDDDHMFKLLVP